MTTENPPWTIERQKDPNYLKLTLDFTDHDLVNEGFRIFVSADHHWDNKSTNLKLLGSHLGECLAGNIPAFIFGDLYCAMQGKWDRRADQEQLREEHRGNNYLDLLKSTSYKWYRPFSPIIAAITLGNHEGSILQHHQTNLAECLVERLHDYGSPCLYGGYTGFICINVKDSRRPQNIYMFWHHGYGGGGEITRGMIDNSRTRGQYLADIYVSGHIHRRNQDENVVIYPTTHGDIKKKTQWFLRCGAYKEEESNLWHTTKGRSARPLGGWWIDFKYNRGSTSNDHIHNWFDITPVPAI